jgi:cytoskeleton protein RodZ
VFEIGATLREARVRKGLTLVQVEEDTKIRSKYLQALENEEFGDLPGEAYAKGFLRSYATYLGLDAQVILEEYSSRHQAGQAPAKQLEGPSALRRPARARRSGLLFVAVLAVLILAVIYVLGLRSGNDNKTPSTNPSALTRSPSPAASSRPASPSPSASPTIAANLTILKLGGSAKPCYVTVYQNSQATTPVLAATFATGVTHTLRTHGTFIVVLGGDPGSITMIVNGKNERTTGDPSGTVYKITKGKVTRE